MLSNNSCEPRQAPSFAEVDAYQCYQIIHVSLDKHHRLRKWTPINVIKYSCEPRQAPSFAEVDAYQFYQIFM